MRLRVLFFGSVKDIVGRASEEIEMPAGAVLGEVLDYYAKRAPRLSELRGSIVLARNLSFAPAAEPLAEGDEVALLPPVSGGA